LYYAKVARNESNRVKNFADNEAEYRRIINDYLQRIAAEPDTVLFMQRKDMIEPKCMPTGGSSYIISHKSGDQFEVLHHWLAYEGVKYDRTLEDREAVSSRIIHGLYMGDIDQQLFLVSLNDTNQPKLIPSSD
jgi:hypothetical protein